MKSRRSTRKVVRNRTPAEQGPPATGGGLVSTPPPAPVKPSKTLREIMMESRELSKHELNADIKNTLLGGVGDKTIPLPSDAPITQLLNKKPQSVTVDQLEHMVKSRGSEGPAGPPGHVGPAGPVGPQGPPGPQTPGLTGAAGPEGQQGKTGLRGGVGPKGPQGTNGPPGPAGKAGPPGARGPAGSPGPQGPAGATGIAGSPGKRAEAGPRGPPGQRGPDGAPGKHGTDGKEGPKGKDGGEGKAGPPGPPGSPGPQGTPGADGSKCECNNNACGETKQELALPGALDIAYLGSGKWRVETEDGPFTITGRKAVSK